MANKKTTKAEPGLTLEQRVAQLEEGSALMANMATSEALAAQKAALEEMIAEVKDQIVDPETYATAESIEALNIKLEAIAENVEVVLAENEELKDQLEKVSKVRSSVKILDPNEKKPKATIPTETFEVGGKEYKFKMARFTLPVIGTVSAEDAILDKQLQAKIVKEFPGVIEEA